MNLATVSPGSADTAAGRGGRIENEQNKSARERPQLQSLFVLLFLLFFFPLSVSVSAFTVRVRGSKKAQSVWFCCCGGTWIARHVRARLRPASSWQRRTRRLSQCTVPRAPSRSRSSTLPGAQAQQRQSKRSSLRAIESGVGVIGSPPPPHPHRRPHARQRHELRRRLCQFRCKTLSTFLFVVVVVVVHDGCLVWHVQ